MPSACLRTGCVWVGRRSWHVFGRLAGGIGLFFGLTCFATSASVVDNSLLPVRAYSGNETGGAWQNWRVRMMPQGALAVGNGNRLLLFDGARWTSTRSPNSTRIRDFAVDGSRIWIGGESDFGYLQPDATGTLQFHSLLDKVPKDQRDFSDIWQVVRSGTTVYFNARSHLFRWSEKTGMRVWRADTQFNGIIRIGERVLVQHTGYGVVDPDEDIDKPVPGSQALRDARLITALRTRDGHWLVLTMKQGIWRWAGKGFTPWLDAGDGTFKGHYSMDFIEWPDGRLLIGQFDGIAVLSAKGDLLERIDHRRGLPSDEVLSLCADRDGGLWLAQYGSVTHVEFGIPVRYLKADDGRDLQPDNASFVQGRLFVASSRGTWRQEGDGHIIQLPIPAEESWQVMGIDTGALVAATNGVFWLPDPMAPPEKLAHPLVLKDLFAYGFAPSKRFPGRVYVALDDGLGVLQRAGDGWRDAGRLPDIGIRTSPPVEDADGSVWAGSNVGQLFHVVFADNGTPHTQSYGAADGLPKGNVRAYWLNGRAVFATTRGLWRYQPNQKPFLRPDPEYQGVFKNAEVFRLLPVDKDHLWVRLGGRTGLAIRDAGGWRLDQHWFQAVPSGPTNLFALAPDGSMFTDIDSSLVRIDPAGSLPASTAPAILAGGIDQDGKVLVGKDDWFARPRLPPFDGAINALRVRFALPSFAQPQVSRYRSRLVGFQDTWSAWTQEPFRDFTNLTAGKYRFEVQAEDIFGRRQQAELYAFSIPPPWYLTPLAMLTYGLLALLALMAAMWGGRQWRFAQLQARQRELEDEISMRTAQVRAQAAQIRAQDEAKTRFFANVSHEFRTPLTLVIGPVKDVLDRHAENLQQEVKTLLRSAYGNARSMLDLVGQLLDLNRLEAGRMVLLTAEDDLAGFIRHELGRFEAAAHSAGIELVADLPADPVVVWFDANQVDKVIANVLANALKYTPEGGQIRVRLRESQTQVRVEIADSGPGVESEELPHLFERYFQGRKTRMDKPGTGIGLALVRELMELHGGEVSASLPAQGGLSLSLCFRRGREHLRDEQIHDAPVSWRPVESADHVPELSSRDTSAASAEDTPVVLLIDDNDELRAFLRMRLALSYRIKEAANGEEGLAHARAAQPDVIVCDWMMPKLDGQGFVTALRADPEIGATPVLMLTARSTRCDVVAGLQAGADDYLTKPFDSAELIARIEALRARERRLREAIARKEIDLTLPQLVRGDFATRLLEHVRARMHDGSFGIEDLAESMHMDRSTLYRRCMESFETSPAQLLTRLRLEAARDLLQKGGYRVTEVAYAVGFESISYFSRAFKSRFSITPGSLATKETASQRIN